jgi:hypothetical protein
LQPTNLPAPAPIDAQATIDSIIATSNVLTATAQLSLTISPTNPLSTETATLVVASSPTIENSPTLVLTNTVTPSPIPNLTTTPATATGGPELTTVPTEIPANTPNPLTLTPTVGPLTYGTLPPAVPWGDVILVNKAKTEVYVSLQLQNTEAQGAILEYPVETKVKVKAPVGHYVYVVWVGGRKLVGELRVKKGEEFVFNVYRDRVEIQ